MATPSKEKQDGRSFRRKRTPLAVVVNYAGSPADAEAEAAKIKDAGGRAIAVRADVSDPAAVKHLFDEATQAFGGGDVLVNTGVMLLSTIADADDPPFDRQVAINLEAVFNGIREAAHRLRAGGRVISFSSNVVGLCSADLRALCRDQGWHRGHDPCARQRNARQGHHSECHRPRPDRDHLFLDGKPQAAVDHLSHLAPLERLGTPADIAAAVSFLAGPDGSWINGQVLRANGGIV